jgi:nucleoside phosphorylase
MPVSSSPLLGDLNRFDRRVTQSKIDLLISTANRTKLRYQTAMTHEADVLIVTVTKVESAAVIQAFERATGVDAAPQPIGDRTYLNLGIINNARFFLTLSEMGSIGLGASSQTVSKGIEALSPTAVIMVGIAFGVNEQKQSIGDILVAKQLYLYDLQRKGTQDGQEQITVRGDKPHASSWLIQHFRMAELKWSGATVRFGVVLTGEKLIDNIDYRDRLRTLESEAIGGEMEGTGMYVACQDNKVDWILVKGICDWADGNKAEDKASRQNTAANNAAAFVLHALQFGSIDWQQRRGKGFQQPKFSGVVTNQDVVNPVLAMALRSLGILEEQAAGFGKLQMPAHLRIELDEKRQEVSVLEARLRNGEPNV